MRSGKETDYHQSNLSKTTGFDRRGRYLSHVSNTAIRGAPKAGERLRLREASESPREDCTPPGALTSPHECQNRALTASGRTRRGTTGRKPGQKFSVVE